MFHLAPLTVCLAFGPLALYFAALGLVNLSRRPALVSGGRDSAALALALFGLMVVGPFDLFMPAQAANRLGAFVWLLLSALYLFACTLAVMYQRPRYCLYNVPLETLHPALTRLASSLDASAGWTGKHLVLPNWRLEIAIEHAAAFRNVTLICVGEPIAYVAWQRFGEQLEQMAAQLPVAPNRRGLSFLTIAAALLIVISSQLARDPDSIARDLKLLLRM